MANQLAQEEARCPTGEVAVRSLARQGRADDIDESFSVAMGMLAELAPGLWNDELASAVTAVSQAPSDVHRLRELGRRLVDSDLFELAVPILTRARHLEPGCAGLLSELAIALEADGRSDVAMEMLLEESDLLESSFVCRHLLAHNALMAGRLQASRGFAEAQLPTTEAESVLASRVLEMVERAGAVTGTSPLDCDDLRGWQFVATGGVLLHLSPYGPELPMHGRYGVVADSYQLIRHCAERLRWALSVLGHRPVRVMASDDLGSVSLAAAVGRLLGIPVTRIDSDPGLIVAYDTSSLSEEASDALSARNPGQLLYAHATCWTEQSIAPDLAGIVYQSISAPWDIQRRQTPSEPPISRRGHSGAATGPLTDRIMHASCGGLRFAPGDTDEALIRFLSAVRPFVGSYGPGERPRMPAGGGPVRSPRV